ncbi:hypothetical protein AgCh_021511 [Apium graveolens]
MPLYEALYRRRCRFPLCWDEVGEHKIIGPELVQQTQETVVLIKKRLVAAQDRLKKYADQTKKDREYEVGDSYHEQVDLQPDLTCVERPVRVKDQKEQVLRNKTVKLYKGFMARPKESITHVFERFNKLINDLQLHDKYYEAKEVNLKFLLTLPDHLELKISAIREGRDLSKITLEVLYGILKIYELEMIQRKSLRAGQGHVMDGSSALIVNEGQTSNDEPRSQTLVASTSEEINNDSQEQVILELEEDEFYTLDELDELDQSMAYLGRKFSNIRVKKPRFFNGKGQSFNKDNSWKGKGKYTSDSKNGYKIRSVDRSKIRCYYCDELGHFATECRKPKKVKKDKAYLELEAKCEALLKK